MVSGESIGFTLASILNCAALGIGISTMTIATIIGVLALGISTGTGTLRQAITQRINARKRQNRRFRENTIDDS